MRFNASRGGGGGGFSDLGHLVSPTPHKAHAPFLDHLFPHVFVWSSPFLVEGGCPERRCIFSGGLVPQGRVFVYPFGGGRVPQEEASFWGPLPHKRGGGGSFGLWGFKPHKRLKNTAPYTGYHNGSNRLQNRLKIHVRYRKCFQDIFGENSFLTYFGPILGCT